MFYTALAACRREVQRPRRLSHLRLPPYKDRKCFPPSPTIAADLLRTSIIADGNYHPPCQAAQHRLDQDIAAWQRIYLSTLDRSLSRTSYSATKHKVMQKWFFNDTQVCIAALHQRPGPRSTMRRPRPRATTIASGTRNLMFDANEDTLT